MTIENGQYELMTRREWLKSLARYLTVSMLIGAFALILRRNSSCPDSSCPGCPEQAKCGKPEAEKFRFDKQHGDHK